MTAGIDKGLRMTSSLAHLSQANFIHHGEQKWQTLPQKMTAHETQISRWSPNLPEGQTFPVLSLSYIKESPATTSVNKALDNPTPAAS